MNCMNYPSLSEIMCTNESEKPTREERLKAYEYAREWLNATMDNQVGICTLLRKAISPSLLILSDFPEFIEAKPEDKDVGGYWFSSAKERIQVLTKIINKMKEEPLIKPGQQFKIDSIEELKEVYDPEKWYWPLKMEITDFEIGMNYAVNYNGKYLLLNKSDEYETIPNPFKKSKWQRIKDILEDPECEKWEDVEEKDPIREELRALREEVDKLNGELTLIKEQELAKEKQEDINKILEIMRQSLATKECCKEKPKESEELKIKHPSCELSLWKDEINNVVDIEMNTREGLSVFCCQKSEAIKIVNYLKKHFEI